LGTAFPGKMHTNT